MLLVDRDSFPSDTLSTHAVGFNGVESMRRLTLLRPLYKVENAFARMGMWRWLSRCYEQTALCAQTWLQVACVW